ncbi:MAG: hypothetical protein Q8P41_31955 [Pseudomonadota bacterium]|nr:hypothetical protein [Pseudomonadota bacterium]
MSVELLSLGTVEGLEVRAAPLGGVVWDRGALVRLDGGDLDWRLAFDEPHALARHGRRLYAGIGEWLVCLDARTGGAVWSVDCGAPVSALDAHAEGVDALAADQLVSLDPRGAVVSSVSVGRRGGLLRRVGGIRYVAAEDGIWRIPPGERAALLYACVCHGLYDRAGRLHALGEGAPGTVLIEDDGLAMVWPFADAASHLIAPWGKAEWAVAPRAGRGGLWVVDRRVQTRWQVALPGRASALAVAGNAVALLLDDGGPVLAVVHRDAPQPLLLGIDRADALHAEGDHLYLTHEDRTSILLVRET